MLQANQNPVQFKIGLRLFTGQLACLFLSTHVMAQSFFSFPPPVKSASEEAWKIEFRRAYGLKEGEVLKHLSAPFPSSRADYCKHLKAEGYFTEVDFEKVVMSYRWNGKDCEFSSLVPGTEGLSLISLLELLEIPGQEIECDKELRPKIIPGEFVFRAGTTPVKVIPQFERILNKDLNIPVRLSFKQLERVVTVASGKYESKPLTDRKVNQIDLFAVDRKDDASSGGGSGSFEKFPSATGSYIGRRIVSDLPKVPGDTITWYYHNSIRVLPGPDPNQEPEGVLKNITAQTGLTFKIEKRKVRVLVVGKG